MLHDKKFSNLFTAKLPENAEINDFILREDNTGLVILDQKKLIQVEKQGEQYECSQLELPVIGKFPGVFTTSPDEILIGLKDKNPLIVYNLKEKKITDRYSGPYDEISSIIMFHSKNIILTGSEKYHSVNLWDMKTKKFVTSLTGPYGSIQKLRKIDESQFISITEEDMELWDYDKKYLVTFGGNDMRFHFSEIKTGNLSEDKKRTITMDEKGTIKIMELETRKELFKKKMELEKEEKIFDAKIVMNDWILLLTSKRVLIYDLKEDEKEYEELIEEEEIKFAKLERNVLLIHQNDEIQGYRLNI